MTSSLQSSKRKGSPERAKRHATGGLEGLVPETHERGEQGHSLSFQASNVGCGTRGGKDEARDDTQHQSVLPPCSARSVPAGGGATNGSSECFLTGSEAESDTQPEKQSQWQSYWNFVAGAPARSRARLGFFVRCPSLSVNTEEATVPTTEKAPDVEEDP